MNPATTIWRGTYDFASGEKFINISPALHRVKDNLTPFFYLTPYSVITYFYAIIALVSFHFLYLKCGKYVIKLGDFLKHKPFDLLSIMLRQFRQVFQERFLIKADYHTRIFLGPGNIS